MDVLKMIRSFKYAFKGLKFMILQENNFKFQLLATLVVCIMSYYFQLSKTHFSILFMCCVLVLSLEICNTAIEKVVDLVSPEFKPLAGLVKDLSAAAVLLASIGSLIIAGIILVSML